MKKTKKIIIFASLLFIVLCLNLINAPTQDNWIIKGDSVWIDDSKVYINVTPHTSNDPIIEFKSKVYSGNIDIVVGFNTTQVIPKGAKTNPHLENITKSYTCNYEFNYTQNPNHFWCFKTKVISLNNQTGETENRTVWIFDHYFETGNLLQKTAYWTEEKIIWDDISGKFNSVEHTFKGFNKWYYKTGININAEQLYKLKLDLQPQTFDNGHKYFFGIKLSSQTLREAFDSGTFYYIDPWTTGLNNGLVDYFPFNESSGTNLSNEINALASGTLWNMEDPGDWVTGKRGNALIFDGVDEGVTDAGGGGIIEYNYSYIDNFSYSGWFKTIATGGSIIGSFAYGNDAFLIGISSGKVGATLRDKDGRSHTMFSNSTVNDSNWHHFVFVRDSPYLLLYVDGSLIITEYDTTEDRVGFIGRGLYIGVQRDRTSTQHHLNGTIDEIGIWNRSLSASEVSNLWNYGNGLSYTDNPDEIIPIVTLNNPVNNTNSSSASITFSVNCSDNLGLSYCNLYGNWSGRWHSNQTNSTPVNASQTNFTNIYIPDGKYVWSGWANDSAGNSVFGVNRTLIVDTTNPNIVLNNPINNTNSSSASVTFSANCSDNLILDYCNLYGNWSGGWHQNQTNSTPYNNSQTNFTLNIPNGKYIWSYFANDTVGNSNFGVNNTLTIDTINPNIIIVTPTGTVNSQTITIDTTITDNIYLHTCLYNVTRGASIEIANTLLNCSNPDTIDVVSGDATYVLHVFANDTLGNHNYTSGSFVVDTTQTPTPPSEGGGGGITIIVGDNITGWSLTTIVGGEKLEIYKIAGTLRSFDILFENLGESNRVISLKCDNVIGELCQYVSFSEQTFNLAVGKKIVFRNSFTIDFPEKIKPTLETFNIVAKDDLNREISLTVETRKTTWISEIGIKLISSKNIFGLGIPYVFIFIVVWIGTGVGSKFMFLKEVKRGTSYALIIGMFMGFLVILIL